MIDNHVVIGKNSARIAFVLGRSLLQDLDLDDALDVFQWQLLGLLQLFDLIYFALMPRRFFALFYHIEFTLYAIGIQFLLLFVLDDSERAIIHRITQHIIINIFNDRILETRSLHSTSSTLTYWQRLARNHIFHDIRVLAVFIDLLRDSPLEVPVVGLAVVLQRLEAFVAAKTDVWPLFLVRYEEADGADQVEGVFVGDGGDGDQNIVFLNTSLDHLIHGIIIPQQALVILK